MVGANLTEFNFRILDLLQRPQVQSHPICEIERMRSTGLTPEPELVQDRTKKKEADAVDAASTSPVKVPGGHK